MAPSQQGALATTTAVAVGGGGDSTSTTSHSQTIVGSHVLRIDSFSATKDLGVGKSIKSSTFFVGGHSWYIECYPCGDVDDSAGWVSLYLRRQQDNDDHGSSVYGYCKFTLMDSPPKEDDGCFNKLSHPRKLIPFAADELMGTDFIKREELEWLLDDDCFQVRCVVFIHKFPPAPPYLAADESETMAWSHLLIIDDGYSKIRRTFEIGDAIESSEFRVGGHSWYFEFYPRGVDKDNEEDRVGVSLFLNDAGSYDEVKIRFDITLLTRDGKIITSTQDFTTFTEASNAYNDNYLIMMEHESSPLLQDGIQIRCDFEVVDGITATPNMRRSVGGDGDLQASQQVRVRGDVTFQVGGHLFTAHKCVLTTRCTAFMTECFGSSGNYNAGATDTDETVRINDMEPKVFEALLHFIYTDALPEVSEEDRVGVAQGLLVAADRYAMVKLKSICDDVLCSYINDPRTAVTTLNIADKHGCHRLKEACMKYLMDRFA